ncbi:MAG: cyclopropane-fatty-acyl-phospholipid synthase family protein [Candidatus Obscuribacterales bacterium]|nr:cyclopropane-fatty-acyl-phospholipid synthase family protein [Candidatus Obscuribacterales bacterium]
MNGSLSQSGTFSPDKESKILLYDIIARGALPEWLIRAGIRRMLAQKLRELERDSAKYDDKGISSFVAELRKMPIAIATDRANQQHYEVPAEFFEIVLGPHAKYSCGYWDSAKDLEGAEKAMLELTCLRADIQDGQEILDLGCGWGAFSLFAAEKYPKARITAFSNSRVQREFIEAKAARSGLDNLRVFTGDINLIGRDFFSSQYSSRTAVGARTFEGFDRVVSVEMFEHMKNYELLLEKISGWMKESACLFVHIFSHKDYAYHYDSSDPNDWLTKYFFTGGTMPSDSLLSYFQKDLKLSRHWVINGRHYQKTADAWLLNMTENKERLMPILASCYGEAQSRRWWIYWRLFLMACAELWGYSGGNEWFVSHYLFAKRSVQAVLD